MTIQNAENDYSHRSIASAISGSKMLSCKNLLAGVFSVATFVVTAAEYYVATNGVDEVGRGSEANPFQTIQYAIDSASAGSTIWVKPGVYDKGGAENASASGVHSNRVVLTKKIYLKSTDGAAVTHIVGAPDPNTGGIGPKAVRCIVSPNNNSADSTITGFTLRDGYGDDGTQNHRAGGFLQYNGNKWIIISDCVISNCAAFSHGGARGGSFARCLFANNKITKEVGSAGSAVGTANLVNCIITQNGSLQDDCAVSDAKLVNCTVVGNRGYGIRHDASTKLPTGCKLFNTVVCCNGKNDAMGSASYYKNCVVGGYPIVSPIDLDYRVVAGREAEMGGDVNYLKDLTTKDVLDIYMPSTVKEFDFYGNVIDLAKDKVHVGAVQASASVMGGAVRMSGPLTCGAYCSTIGLPTYAQSTNCLTQWRVRHASSKVSSGVTNYLRYVDSRSGSYISQRSVTFDDELIVAVPPTSSIVITNTPEYSKALWVDPSKGSDDVNDGSEMSPFATIQKAVDVGQSKTVIYLAPGLYDQGGMSPDDPMAADYGLSRVLITNSHIRIVGKAGAENTIIAGAPDPITKGFGENAVRCVLSTCGVVVVQGVTLSNAWTHAEMTSPATTNALKGAAARKITLRDSIVTCCHGCSSVISETSAYRCRIFGNEAKGNSLISDSGNVVCSWVGPNDSRSSTYYGYVGTSLSAWFSTLVVTNGQSAFSQNADIFNCIAVGGQYVRKDMDSKGNVFWNFANVQSGSAGLFESPRLTADKLHIKSTSPAITAGVAPTVAGYAAKDPISKQWYSIASTDIDGNLVCLNADGTATAGCAHETVPAIRTFFLTFR